MESTMITVEIPVDVYWKMVSSIDGTDADGNRGWRTTERMIDHVEVSEGGLPPAVQDWVEQRAVELFEAHY